MPRSAAFPAPTDAGALTPLRRNLSMAAILLSTLTATIDASIVNVALPQLSSDLHVSASETVWVTTAFLMAVACCVPATSALGDQIGRRRMFLIGAPVFIVASIACALSPTLSFLVASRVLQGVGSAMILAVAIPLYRTLFPPERLGSVLGVNAMTVALGTCAGPTLGGLILSALSWPWLFLINVPIGVVSITLAIIFLPKDVAKRGDFDAFGAVLAAVAIACFLLGIHQLVDRRTATTSAILLAGFVAVLILFLRRERRAARPIIPLTLFTGRFSLAVVTAFWSFFGQGVAFVALPFLFQSAYGATPLQSALLFTPWPLMIVFMAPLAGRLADRISPAALSLIGIVVFAAGLLSLALLPDHPPTWEVLVRTALTGLGFGFFQSPNNRDMMSAAPIRNASAASAVLNLNRTLGQSTGSGAVSMALVLAGTAGGTLAGQAEAANAVLYVAVVGATLAAILCAVKLRASVVAGRAAES